MAAEETQQQGIEGVDNVKRWLEASVRFHLPYTVYDSTVRTTLSTLNGAKRFDLRGEHYDASREGEPKEIYIEVKNVTTDKNLSS